MLSGLIAVAIAHDLMAQVTNSTSAPGRYISGQDVAPGVFTSIITLGDSVLERRTFDPNEEVQVIVQFVSPPLSSVHRTQGMNTPAGTAFSTLQSQIEGDHTRFRSDLVRLEAGVTGNRSTVSILKAPGSRVSAEYRKVFNGVALRSRRWLVDQVRALPYVRSITPDRQVRALDSTSNHQIGADSVWAHYGLTGAGVRIGVLDTGIDYMHPDLGGGIGPGFKVAGGWSFVEHVTDPADDNGHGTHVAGIIAAHGSTLQGVAPDATLYAIKVLSSEGWGLTSWTMAGLERAVDPNGDMAMDDHLDIVNLSLGGRGDPTDALSQAIDNVTAAGMLCVAAAGNDGSSGQTIKSPGCASSALTVGACDALSSLASFSSRGPANYLFTVKPDILAPGVSITSTYLGGSYEIKSGTSMATPHATGAAALVKQLHPDWTPAMLKGVLMGSAKNLGQDLWSQGKGRLDVLKAVRARVVAMPQTLSFGLDDLTVAQWRQTDTITVYNVSDTVLTLEVGQFAGLPAGVSLTPDASAITVPAHGTGQLAVTLEVNNSIVQFPQTEFNDVTSSVALVSPQDTLQIPWATVIGSYIELQVTAPENSIPVDAFFTPLSGGPPEESLGFASTGGATWHLRKLLPPGSYEVVVRILSLSKYGVVWIVRDSVNIDPVASLTMSDSDAPYRVGAALKDENGLILDSSYTWFWSTLLSSRRTGVQMFSMISGLTEPHWAMDRVSPLSLNYVFDYFYTTDFEKHKTYSYAGQVSPVYADQVTDIKAGDLVRRDIEYRVPFGAPSLKSLWAVPFGDGFTYFGNEDSPPLTAPFQQVWYAQGHPLGNFPWNGVLLNHRYWFDGSKDSVFDPRVSTALLITPNQAPGLDGVLRSSLHLTNSPTQESRGKKVVYGLGPRHYFGRMDNSVPTLLRVETNTNRGTLIPVFFPQDASIPLFLNQAMDVEPVLLRLGLKDSTGQLTYETTSLYPNHMDSWIVALKMSLPKAGRFTLQLWDPSSPVLSLKGAAIVNLTADTRLSDPNPPAMTSFNIIGADSEYTDMLLPGEAGRVEFRTSDAETGLRLVNLFYHTDSNRAWMTVPLSRDGDLFRAQLPAFTSSDGFISLRVLATDVAGNSMDYRAEPAAHIGPDYTYANRAPRPVQLLMPTPGGMLQLYEPGPPVVFSWHGALDYDGWDTLSYTFHIRGGVLGTSADRWVRDTTVTLWLMGLMSPDEVYHWWVETTDGHVVVASDTATFRTSSTVLAVQGENSDLPKEYALSQNYPNPFNPTTTIAYDLPLESHVSLRVYNLLGQEVMKLVDAEQRAGRYAVTVDGQGLASGVYIYRLQAVSLASTGSTGENFVAVRKFLILR